MAHFAEIDENNIVKRVIVISNSLEPMGSEWCNRTFGGNWIQTSYNSTIRKNYAGIGYHYDQNLDAFIPPKPYESWVLNTSTCRWEPPFEAPNNGKIYEWNETSKSWIEQQII